MVIPDQIFLHPGSKTNKKREKFLVTSYFVAINFTKLEII
jgi:hypothetical protein